MARMIAKPNSFGYRTRWSSAQLQLQALLKLQNNRDIFDLLKANIKRLTQKYMKIEQVPSRQTLGIRAIKAELKKQYPDIFASEESEKRLYFAVRVVYHTHYILRFHSRKKQHHSTAPTSPITHNPTVPTSAVMRNRRKDQQSQLNTQESVSQSNLVNVQRTPRSISRPTAPTSRIMRSQRKNQQSQLDTQELTSQYEDGNPVDAHGMPQFVAQTLSRRNNCSMDTNADVTMKISSCTTHYQAIYDFLDASMPPMTHLVDAFINLGCINIEFLLAISTWSFERIGYILDQLSPGCDGKKITEMEKFILQNHFKDYFA